MSNVNADENYYDKGKKALNDKDYIKAVKYLFAFKVLKKEILKKPQHKELAEELDSSIESAEKIVRASMMLAQSLNLENSNRDYFRGSGTLRVNPGFLENEMEVMILKKDTLDKEIKLEEIRKENFMLMQQTVK